MKGKSWNKRFMLNTYFLMPEIRRFASRWGICINETFTCQNQVKSSKQWFSAPGIIEPIFSLGKREIVLLFVFLESQVLAAHVSFNILR